MVCCRKLLRSILYYLNRPNNSMEALPIRTLKSGSLLIDSSTIDPSVAIEISKKVTEKASVFMDAPVSGGS